MKRVTTEGGEPVRGILESAIDENAASYPIAATVFHGADIAAHVDGFDIEGRIATRDGKRFDLDLVTDEFAYYISPDADETAGVAMFRLGPEGPSSLASDNWLATDAYSKDVDRIVAGSLRPVFAGPDARAAIEAAKEVLEGDGWGIEYGERPYGVDDVLNAAEEQAEMLSGPSADIVRGYEDRAI